MIFDKIQEKRATNINVNDWFDIYSANNGYEDGLTKAFEDSDYYKCINIISSAIGKVPLLVKQSTDKGEIIAKNHPLYYLLSKRPNPYMTAVDTFKCLEAIRQHNGESAAVITRDINGSPTGIYPVTIMEIIVDDVGLIKTSKTNPILVGYTCGKNGTGQEYWARYEDVLHFKGLSLDVITSMCVRKKLQNIFKISASGKGYQSQLFDNGLTSKAVVQLTSDIKDEKELKKMQDKFNRLYSANARILTMPAGFNVQPLNLNLTDAEFSILRKMSTTDIFTSFGVPLYLSGDLTSYNNNSMEMSTLSFYNDTLQILFTSAEQEANYKLLKQSDVAAGYYLEYDTTALYKLDPKTLSEILVSQVQNSILRPNEARRKLGYDDDEHGNELMLHSGMVPISSALNSNNKPTPKGGDLNE